MGDRSFYRFGAGALMAGAVLGLIFNLLHPRSGEGATVRGHLDLVTNSEIWLLDHIAIAIAIALGSLGAVVLGRSLIENNRSPWAWLFLFSLATSTALLFVTIALDTWVMKETADNWAAAQGAAKDAAFASAEAVVNITFGLLAGAIGGHFGVTALLAGVALLYSDYPKNLAYLFLIGGVIGFVTALILAAAGPSAVPLNILFPISSILFTIAAFWAGWILWKRTDAVTLTPGTQERVAT